MQNLSLLFNLCSSWRAQCSAPNASPWILLMLSCKTGLSLPLVFQLCSKPRTSKALIVHLMCSHAGQVYDPSIMAYRPQRMSIASTKSTISWSPQDHAPELRPETRRSSVSSYASVGSQNSIYSQAHTTATSMGSRRSSFSTQLKARSTQPLAPVFKRLPAPVYECILQQLKVLHNEPYMQSCATCYLRDLHSLALTSRAWDRAVRPRL